MIVIPAIDLKDGYCVRLRQGRMDESTVFSDDPVAMAGRWYEEGARRLHIVDLDGAIAGKPKHASVVRQILEAYPDVALEVGGGLRSERAVEEYLDAGAQWVVLGTVAVKEPELAIKLCEHYPQRIMIGLDECEGYIASDGWVETSRLSALDMARAFSDYPVAAFVHTDIRRDGMMEGINISATLALAKEVSKPVIASGGVRHLDDIRDLHNSESIYGVIVGRALYQGSVHLREALSLL